MNGDGSSPEGVAAEASILAPLAALAADAAGPLPDYHPACLRAALLLGRIGVAAAALRALLRALLAEKTASEDRKKVTLCWQPAWMTLSSRQVARLPQAADT